MYAAETKFQVAPRQRLIIPQRLDRAGSILLILSLRQPSALGTAK
jgi:hypothetical protein